MTVDTRQAAERADDLFQLVFAPAPGAGARLDALLAEHVALRRRPGAVTVVGVAGGVAAGKTVAAEALAAAVRAAPDAPRVTVVAADGFLFSNRELAARGLTARKGFPESFDTEALYRAIATLRAGRPAAIPCYSHRRYDVEAPVVVEPPDVVILEGINVLQVPPAGPVPSDLVDLGIYLDAGEADLWAWYRQRVQALVDEGRDDPGSFYHQWAEVGRDEVAAAIAGVWEGINVPNLRGHIVPSRLRADVVVRLDGNHRPVGVFLRR